MAFPYLMSENFDAGSRGVFDAETDSTSILDFPHYTELSRTGAAPYRGSYCMRVKPAGGTTSAYLQENTALDQAGAATVFYRWYVYLGRDFSMAGTDKFSIFEAESVADTTTEYACGFDISSGTVRFWMAETSAASASTLSLGTLAEARDKWYCIELKSVLDNAGNNDGTLDGWVNGAPLTQITALDQGAIVDVKLGIIGLDATTTGTILFDQFDADDGRLFPYRDRFPAVNGWVHAAQEQVLVGPGRFAIAFTGTAAAGSNTMTVYDTDRFAALTDPTPLIALTNAAQYEFMPGHDIFQVNRGAYVVIAGTAAQAFVSLDCGGLTSQAAYVNAGLKGGF